MGTSFRRMDKGWWFFFGWATSSTVYVFGWALFDNVIPPPNGLFGGLFLYLVFTLIYVLPVSVGLAGEEAKDGTEAE